MGGAGVTGHPSVVSVAGDPGRARGLPLAPDRARRAGWPSAGCACRWTPRRASGASSSAASWPPTWTSSTPSCSTTSTGSPSSSRRACASRSPGCATASRPTASGSPAASTGSLGEGEDLEFEFEVKGAAAQHILAAVYAAGALPAEPAGPRRWASCAWPCAGPVRSTGASSPTSPASTGGAPGRPGPSTTRCSGPSACSG